MNPDPVDWLPGRPEMGAWRPGEAAQGAVGKPTLAYNNTINAFASVPVTVQAAKQDQILNSSIPAETIDFVTQVGE